MLTVALRMAFLWALSSSSSSKQILIHSLADTYSAPLKHKQLDQWGPARFNGKASTIPQTEVKNWNQLTCQQYGQPNQYSFPVLSRACSLGWEWGEEADLLLVGSSCAYLKSKKHVLITILNYERPKESRIIIYKNISLWWCTTLTNHINNGFECSQDATQHFRILFSQVLI